MPTPRDGWQRCVEFLADQEVHLPPGSMAIRFSVSAFCLGLCPVARRRSPVGPRELVAVYLPIAAMTVESS